VTLKIYYKTHKASIALLVVVVGLLLSLAVAPVFSISANQCSSCHPVYNQQLDLLEGNNQNSIPTSIEVGQTLTVKVALQNINNAQAYTEFSSVAATLRSQNNHFTVNSETYTISNMAIGTASATWQITGTSAGSDQLLITASAINSHKSVGFSDSYSPNPQITVTGSTSNSPTASPPATVTPTPPNPTATAVPTQTSTSSTVNPDRTSNPTSSVTPTPTSSVTSTPTPTTTENPTATPTPSQPNELDSNMLYIHPPLAIVSYIFIFIFTALTFKTTLNQKSIKLVGLVTWILIFAGLITGMLWAQLAWGSYWTWDPKEILTLTLFFVFTVGQIAFFEGKGKVAQAVFVVCCLLAVVTGVSSYLVSGAHAFI
jgi:hypothetical protein